MEISDACLYFLLFLDQGWHFGRWDGQISRLWSFFKTLVCQKMISKPCSENLALLNSLSGWPNLTANRIHFGHADIQQRWCRSCRCISVQFPLKLFYAQKVKRLFQKCGGRYRRSLAIKTIKLGEFRKTFKKLVVIIIIIAIVIATIIIIIIVP